MDNENEPEIKDLDEAQDRGKKIDAIIKGINAKSANKGNPNDLIFRASDHPDKLKATWYPTGIIQVDEATGGGVPRGSVTTIHGAWGAGKTFLAMSVAANLTREKKYVMYVSLENMYLDLFVERLGLDPKFVYNVVGKDHGDEIVDVIENLLWDSTTRTPRNYFDCIIVDSITNFVPKANVDKLERDGAEGGGKVASRAKLIDDMLSRMYGRGLLGDTIVILIAQDRAAISTTGGGKGPDTEMSGGNAVKFNSKLILKLSKKNDTKLVKGVYELIGHTTKLLVAKNSINGQFGKRGEYSVIYGAGIDDSIALFNKASLPEWGYIIPGEKRGSFVILTSMGDIHCKGKEGVRTIIKTRAEISSFLRKAMSGGKPKPLPTLMNFEYKIEVEDVEATEEIE